MGSAWAAGSEGAAEHTSFFADPESWVAIAFLLFVVLLGRLLWARLSAMLDKRSADIARALGDAEKLRNDALRAKADAQRTLDEAAAEASAIVAQAREEAQRMQQHAAQHLETAIALREQQALDRIAQSEVAAAKHVRDTAIDLALTATRTLLREQVGSGKAETLVDEAIAELPRRLH
ncbi:MAG: F0F1 ATP synthase subunit B [Proteobacteria bacterium]|nr:F0F1 ATP synthase subunit B [Pseudomonadota bacterium]